MNRSGAQAISLPEAAFIARAIEGGLRLDGRGRLEPRAPRIAFGDRPGSVEVALGDTKVMAVATAELTAPFSDRPTEGLLAFYVELSPMASPSFEPGRPSEAAIELTRLLDRVLRKSQAIDAEALCVVAARHVWSVRVDVAALDACGNLADAAALAALLALRHVRIPAVAVSGVGEEATVRVLPTEQAEPTPLTFHHTPVPVSLGLFRAAEGGETHFVVDPTDREELVMAGNLSVVINQHGELCALHKPGGLPVEGAALMAAVGHAAEVARATRGVIEAALAAQAELENAAAEELRRTGRVPVPSADGPGATILDVALGGGNGAAGDAPMAEAAPA